MVGSEKVAALSTEEFDRQAIEVIRKEFGLSGVARLMTRFRFGERDYTAQHEKDQQPEVDEIMLQLSRLRDQKA